MSLKILMFVACCVLGAWSLDDRGCWKEYTHDRALPYHRGRVRTVGECVRKCKDVGLPFAGIHYGAECYCGFESYKKHGKSYDECSFYCNNDDPCGYNAISIYATGLQPEKYKDPEGYMGCWDDRKSRALPLLIGDVSGLGECIMRCKKEEQPFAAVQNGKECRCGIFFKKYGKSEDCDKKCRVEYGICGGKWAMSVYAVYGDPKNYKQPEGYMGCWADKRNSRAMQVRAGFAPALQVCIKRCKDKRQPFAALEFSTECWCGNSFKKYGKSNGCKFKCLSQMGICGGRGAMSVYAVDGHPDKYKQPEGYMGCWTDRRSRAMQQGAGYVLKVRECIKRCKDKGQPFAALEFGKECWCGHSFMKYGKSSGCKTKCRSFAGICGGKWAMSVYAVGEHPDKYKQPKGYKGCWTDKRNRAMETGVGYVYYPRECIKRCKAKNEPYAALEFGKECWCGSTSYKTYGKSSGCKTKCRSLHGICGGDWAMSVYKVNPKN